MKELHLYCDAAQGKIGGIGLVMVSEGPEPVYYEYEAPLPLSLDQTQSELFAILMGLDQVEYVLKSHKVKPKDIFLRVFTDSQAASYAITYGTELMDKTTRVMVKRIVRSLTRTYFSPRGGGAGYYVVSSQDVKSPKVLKHMKRAHVLSRQARTKFKDIM